MVLKIVLIVLKLVDIDITFKNNVIGLTVSLGDRIIIDRSWNLGSEITDSKITRKIKASPKGEI